MKVRFSIRDLLWLTAAIAIVAGATLVGCHNPFETVYEKRDLTYEQFREFLPNDLDLRNCQHIFVADASTRDSYDLWLKCEMTKSQYESLVADRTASTGTIDPVFDEDKLNNAAPKWWKFESEKQSQHWFQNKDKRPSHHPGSAMFFDEATGTFRLWEWSRQHEMKPSDFVRKW